MKSEMADDRTHLLYSRLLRLRDRLQDRGDRLVLAESCTAGLVAAELGKIPGISDILCGSMVVYRTATKAAWLGIPSLILQDPTLGPVSAEVTVALAQAVLEKTPEATIAGAITGHLGPESPPMLDGQLFLAFARRGAHGDTCEVDSHKLSSPPPANSEDIMRRVVRQQEAAHAMLDFIERKV